MVPNPLFLLPKTGKNSCAAFSCPTLSFSGHRYHYSCPTYDDARTHKHLFPPPPIMHSLFWLWSDHRAQTPLRPQHISPQEIGEKFHCSKERERKKINARCSGRKWAENYFSAEGEENGKTPFLLSCSFSAYCCCFLSCLSFGFLCRRGRKKGSDFPEKSASYSQAVFFFVSPSEIGNRLFGRQIYEIGIICALFRNGRYRTFQGKCRSVMIQISFFIPSALIAGNSLLLISQISPLQSEKFLFYYAAQEET